VPSNKKYWPANKPGWMYRIYSAADLTNLLGFTSDAFSAELGPDDVAEALREAGAPEPWQKPPVAVGRIDNFVPVGISLAHREVRAALSKLRRFLPDVIEELEQQHRFVNDPGRFQRVWSGSITFDNGHTDHLELYRYINSILGEHDYRVPLKKGPTANWHANAISLLNVYRQTVGPKSGISADGPAVKFIEIMMKRLSGEAPERPAIEAAIRTWPYWIREPA